MVDDESGQPRPPEADMGEKTHHLHLSLKETGIVLDLSLEAGLVGGLGRVDLNLLVDLGSLGSDVDDS